MSTDPEIRPIRSHEEFLAALRVRVEVFVDEQGGPLTDEPDGWDESARHFILVADGSVVGTARLYRPEAGVVKLGRIAILPAYRGRGWGMRLVRDLLAHARAMDCGEPVLDVQAYAVAFYERLGFVAEGEEFLDAGIPHRRMRLAAAKNKL